MSQTIHKKVLPEYFNQILSGNKTFEVRLADWNCAPGDMLILDEIDVDTKQPTGRSVSKRVGYVLHTKDLALFNAEDVERCGYQVISLLDEGK